MGSRKRRKNKMNQLIQDARNDESLQNTLDIAQLLRRGDHANTDVEGETFQDIARQILRVLTNLNLSPDLLQTYTQRLHEYRYVSQVDTLLCGRYIRWIRRPSSGGGDESSTSNMPKLDNGGMLSDVKFLENGVHLSALSPGTRYPRRIKYDNYLIFQRLTEDEMLVLMSRELL